VTCESESGTRASVAERPSQQCDAARRLAREIGRRGFDADPFVVADLAKVGEERRVIELGPLEREHPPRRVGRMQVTDMRGGPDHDLGILLLARQMIEIDHQLEVRVVDRVDQLQSLAGGIDDVRLLPPQWLDRQRDAVRLRLRRDPLPEVHQLLERFALVESLGHAARAAATEHDNRRTDFLEAGERRAHVGELRRLIDISRQSGQLKDEEQQLIHRVFEFSDAEVSEAMVPRTQVTGLPVNATLADVRNAFASTGYSRLPIYGTSPDDIIGLLFRKDVDMGRVDHENGFELRDFVRPPAFIPATASLGEALRRMQSARVHFVFVIDEHGGMEGILTLEDLLEEIVGEINDEFDEEVREQIRRDGKAYVLDGMLSIRDANQHLKLDIPEDGGYTTIAGFLMDRAGRILQRGDTVEHERGVFEIERVERRRILRIRLIPHLSLLSVLLV